MAPTCLGPALQCEEAAGSKGLPLPCIGRAELTYQSLMIPVSWLIVAAATTCPVTMAWNWVFRVRISVTTVWLTVS